MGVCKDFQEWWESLPLALKERMNIHDAEFVWMSRDAEIRRLKNEIDRLATER